MRKCPLTDKELSSLQSLLASAPPERLKKVNLPLVYQALTGRTWHPRWNPLPGPQSLAYDSPADELYFGGAAGPGKTFLLLGLAATAHKRSLFLRRESTDLEAAVRQAKEIAGPSAGWKGLGVYGGTLTFPDKRILEFTGCKDEDDMYSFQGRDHDLKTFDELPQFTANQYRFIIGWNRSSDPRQRCRVVAAGNPPLRPEDRWVVEEWAPWLEDHYHDPARPGELRWYTIIDDKLTWFKSGKPFRHKGELIQPRSRTFIPGRLSDNPILAATGYRSVIQAFREPLRSQLLYGDMHAGVSDDALQVIPTAWVRAAMDRWTDEPPEGQPLTCLGVDVARGGKDKTVIAARYAWWFSKLIKIPGDQTPDGQSTASRVEAVYDGNATVNIDISGGFGGSPYDILSGVYGKKKIKGVNFSEATEVKDRTGKIGFVNVRAAMYWKLAEGLDPTGEERLALPPDPELLADLTTPRYSLLARGYKVESKDDIISRIGRSPDAGDAVVLAYWKVKLKEFWMR